MLTKIILLCFCNWTLADWLQFGLLIVGSASVITLIWTLREGQKQSGRALAVNEYNILYQDLKDIILDLQNLKFNINNGVHDVHFNDTSTTANGINILELFGAFNFEEVTQSGTAHNSNPRINDFRNNVIFPLIKKYRILLDFLEEVKKDKLLTENYKAKFYKKIEQYILQGYFRICNNKDPDMSKTYDLSIFNTPRYSESLFNAINNFYIENNAFQLNDLKFYEETF